MNIIFFNDPHFSLSAPEGRKEGYGKQILDKLDFIIEYANKHDAYICCTGDWFRLKSSVTNSEIIALMAVLKKAKYKINTIAGNHDLSGYNFGSYKRRALGVLEEAGVVTLLDNDLFMKDEVIISGKSYERDYENTDPYDVGSNNVGGRFQIHLTHGGLLDKKSKFFDSTCYRDVATEADLIVNGHVHTNIGVKKHNGTIYAMFGSITRTAIDMTEHEPKFMHLRLVDGTPKIRMVEIPIESDVWAPVAKVKKETVNTKAFVEMLQKESDCLLVDGVDKVVSRVLDEQKASKKVIDKTYSFIGELDG